MQTKNRAWVKNAAIIFLSVLLVLTFFSNTIMNYSLPEVAGQNLTGGEISTGIRVEGNVEANMAFNQTIEQTRQIKSVHVKVNETVEAGQLLFMLEQTESEELKAALLELERLELEYEKALLNIIPPDYDSDNLEIKNMKEDLQTLTDRRAKVAQFAEIYAAAKSAKRAAEDKVEALNEEKTALEEQIAEIVANDDLLSPELIKLRDALDAAKTAKEDAEAALVTAQDDYSNHAGSGGSASALRSQVAAKLQQIATLTAERETAISEALDLMNTTYGSSGTNASYAAYLTAKAAYDAAPGDTTKKAMQDALNEALSPLNHSGDIKTALLAVRDILTSIETAEIEVQNLQVDLDAAEKADRTEGYYKGLVNDAKALVTKRTSEVTAAQKAFDAAAKTLTGDLKTKISTKKDEIKAATVALEAATEAADKAAADASVTPESLDSEIKASQRSLEARLLALADKKDSDSLNQQLKDLDMEQSKQTIEDQREKVESLRGKSIGDEITARYAGIITAISGVAGDKLEAGATIASINVSGKGYTLKKSVTNEQAQKVQLGEVVQASGYYWGAEAPTAELIAIKNDPQNPGRGKILEFDVKGDVSVGQQISFTIGSRSQYYEMVVPNSAIREDNDGKFILIAEVKSTPLSNRYIAKRIDVQVITSDNILTAITAAIDNDFYYGGTFVITTSTKPVVPGTQVRLVNQ